MPKGLTIDTLTRLFATRDMLRCQYLSLLDLRDGSVPELQSTAHKLYSALLDLDRLLDDELRAAHDIDEIKDALVKGKEAVDELRDVRTLREAMA